MLAYEHLVSLKLCDKVLRLLTIVITIIAIINGLGLYSAVMANAIAGVAVIAYKLLGRSNSGDQEEDDMEVEF